MFFHPASHNHHADTPARHGRPGRLLLPALCLAAALVLLAVPVAATSQPAPPAPTDDKPVEIPEGATATLVLTPADETVNESDAIWLGESRTYRATVVVSVGPNKAAAGRHREIQRQAVTGETTFKVKEGQNSVQCKQATCMPTTAGTHTVEGEYTVEGEDPTSDYRLLTGTSTLEVRRPVERLVLLPPDRTIRAGDAQRYRAIGLTKDDQRLGNVTRKTAFTVTKADGGPPIPCRRSLCAPTKAGDYTVTGTLREDRREPVAGTANLTVVPGEPETLRLEPVTASVDVGVEQQFEAIGEDEHGNEMDLTERAEFTIVRKGLTTADGGSCVEAGNVATCKGAAPDTTYVVTASLPRSKLSADATLIVLPEPINPSIYSVTPRSGSPNTEVVAKGTTGSCSRVGWLTLEGTRDRKRVV